MSKSIKLIESSLEYEEIWSCPFVFHCVKSNEQIDLSQYLQNHQKIPKIKKSRLLNFTFNVNNYCGEKDEDSLCQSMSISAAKQGFQFAIEKRGSRNKFWSRELRFHCTKWKIYKSAATI